MIDLHCHIIPNVDDGSASLEESIDIAKEAKEAGFTGIFCTSHFTDELFIEKEDYDALLNKLRVDLKDVGVSLYSGNEVFISYDIMDWIKNNRFQTLNGSRYILMELAISAKSASYLNDLVDDVTRRGFVPIIAHPERYGFVQDNPNSLLELIDTGALFQSNYGSFVGVYGKLVQKTASILLKNNMVHFLATDNHRKETIYKRMDDIIHKVKKMIHDETFEILSTINPGLVVKNKNVYTFQPKAHKRFFSLGV